MVSLAWALLTLVHGSSLSLGRLADPTGRTAEASLQAPLAPERPAVPEGTSTAGHERLTPSEAEAEKAKNARIQAERELEVLRQKQEVAAREAKKLEETKQARIEAEARQKARFAALAKERQVAEAQQAVEREQRLEKERHQELRYLDRLSVSKKRREVGKFQAQQSKLDRLVEKRKKEDLLQERQRAAERERKASSILDALYSMAGQQIEEVQQALQGRTARLKPAADALRAGSSAREDALDLLRSLAAVLGSSQQLQASFASASGELEELSSHYVQQVLEKQEAFVSFVHDANKDFVALTAKLFNDTLRLETSHASGVDRIRRSLAASLPGHLEQQLGPFLAPLALGSFAVPGFSYKNFAGTPYSEVCSQATEFLRSAVAYEQNLSTAHHQLNMTAQALPAMMQFSSNSSEAAGGFLESLVRFGYVEILARRKATSGLSSRVAPVVAEVLHCEWSAAGAGRHRLGFVAAVVSILWILCLL